ncbi:MAG: hypothetical protein K2Y04_02315 [Caulobacteraceae bacterium]|nr:hypothetical protein [Caulobacteraceae bacterium]
MTGYAIDWDVTHWVWNDLREAINTLAFDGHPDASREALRRLCEGEWVAQGDWQWAAWAGEIHEVERTAMIPLERWKGLRDGLARGLAPWPDGNPLPTFSNGYSFGRDLPHFEKAEWDWQKNRMETALLLGPDREEWFSASCIVVCDPPRKFPELLPLVDATNEGGRPPKWNWEAAALAIAGQFYLGNLKPKTVADVVRALQEWASSGGAPEMSDAAARPHAKRMFEAFRVWEPDL